MARSRVSSFLVAAVLFGAVIPWTWAQMTAVTNSTSTPIPGAGHDYIKMLSETVDPANGSVSLRLQVPVPPARGLTMPFSFAYDSNGVHFPVGTTPGQADYGTVAVYGSAPAIGGWSYSTPMLTYDSLLYKVTNQLTCTYTATAGYVFQDSSGGRHSLRLSHADAPSPSSCSPYYSEADSGGDDYYQAKLVGGTVPVVVDPEGTVYTFGNTDYQAAGQITSVGANSIEDRNGNIIKGSDTLGRAAVTVSGFGSTGNTVTVSGLSAPYILTWGTASFSFNPSDEPSGTGATYCNGITPASGSQKVITAITLPNLAKY